MVPDEACTPDGRSRAQPAPPARDGRTALVYSSLEANVLYIVAVTHRQVGFAGFVQRSNVQLTHRFPTAGTVCIPGHIGRLPITCRRAASVDRGLKYRSPRHCWYQLGLRASRTYPWRQPSRRNKIRSLSVNNVCYQIHRYAECLLAAHRAAQITLSAARTASLNSR